MAKLAERSTEAKRYLFQVRLTEAERRHLERTAVALGTTASEYIRVWIRAGAGLDRGITRRGD